MAYERQYYTNGDVLDARQMNHMETGIKENSDNIDKHSEEIADITKELYDWIPLTNFELDNGVYMWSADVPTFTENSAYKGLVLNVSGGERYKLYLTLLGTALKNYYLYTD